MYHISHTEYTVTVFNTLILSFLEKICTDAQRAHKDSVTVWLGGEMHTKICCSLKNPTLGIGQSFL